MKTKKKRTKKEKKKSKYILKKITRTHKMFLK